MLDILALDLLSDKFVCRDVQLPRDESCWTSAISGYKKKKRLPASKQSFLKKPKYARKKNNTKSIVNEVLYTKSLIFLQALHLYKRHQSP